MDKAGTSFEAAFVIRWEDAAKQFGARLRFASLFYFAS
jgi:hypothetical protein